MNKVIMRTANFNTIFNICNEAKSKSKMIAIVGYEGSGKTTAFLRYVKENEAVYYVCLKPSMTAKQFYITTLNTLGIEGKELGLNLHDLINKVSFILNKDVKKKLLIFDEAGKFKLKFLEFIHELRDNTIDQTGIVLGGPGYFHDNIKTWKNKAIIGIPEFYRRVNHWQILDRPSPDEVRALCEAYSIEDHEVINTIIKKAENFSIVENSIDEHLMKLEKVKK